MNCIKDIYRNESIFSQLILTLNLLEPKAIISSIEPGLSAILWSLTRPYTTGWPPSYPKTGMFPTSPLEDIVTQERLEFNMPGLRLRGKHLYYMVTANFIKF